MFMHPHRDGGFPDKKGEGETWESNDGYNKAEQF